MTEPQHPRDLAYEWTASDVLTARFGISPLSEAALSLRVLSHPGDYPHLSRWRRQVLQALPLPVLEVLLSLVSADQSTPEFLNPRPTGPVRDFGVELAALRDLPAATIDGELDEIFPAGRPAALSGPAEAVLPRIMAALDVYWARAFRGWWPRMLASLQADVHQRAAAIGSEGMLAALHGLDPSLRCTDTGVVCANPNGPYYRTSVDGRGVVFSPTHFAPFAAFPVHARAEPYVLYPSSSTVLAGGTAPVSQVRLVTLLGDARAHALATTVDGVTSTQLAQRLGVSTSAANQQLRWLHAAGLVEGERRGRSVRYVVSLTGQHLLATLT